MKNGGRIYTMNKRQKRGISLLILIITIIVILIIASAVLLNLTTNNPIDKARETKFKTNTEAYNSELKMTISDKYLESHRFNSSTLNAGIWDGVDANKAGTIKEYITIITKENALKYEIQSGKLVYVGSIQEEIDWFAQMQLSGETAIYTITRPQLSDVNKYKTPYIPTGFTYKEGKWDSGLVIQDTSGNQFVWVPVDGTNVSYAKWCTTGIPYTSTLDDTLPAGFVETDQITNFGGFYIARYESMFDYNGGIIRVASKKSTNITFTNWSATRDNTYNGYLWNYINYSDAKTYSENMAASYGYDTAKVKTNLITGSQWDTTMKWIQNSGMSVTDSRAWGNYTDSITPANVTGYANLQI